MPTSRVLQEVQPGHLEALKAKHSELAARIEREQKLPASSNLKIRRLKSEKLKLKDAITIVEKDNE